MKKRVKKIDLLPAVIVRTKWSKESRDDFENWIAPRRYLERLPYIMTRGGHKHYYFRAE